ncbi:MAG: hypothetical protein N838_10950 [Thiohalocapsa sp. PB-PSB1]|jgi:hypothetical protein|nr:MAG: hypothetical protein N838_29785 [Thiohalocapsa sp. PB-PSB1]QQO53798.1 MAG: hypothetical protein N838_10950 [Thiohalocapsa sp. PB-PSB1]
MKRHPPLAALAAVLTIWAPQLAADSAQARCEIYLKGSDTMETMVPCTFSQRQGHVTIARDDGVTHYLEPAGDVPGNFRDPNDNAVYRQSGLGEAGLIFRFPTESVFVYWDRGVDASADADNPTAPFATTAGGGEYDATTLLRCKAAADSAFGNCPAGILRMDNAQASIVIQSPGGAQFTVNFMTDYVNATVGEVKSELNGDLWTIVRDNGEVYEVPLAAIEGG